MANEKLITTQALIEKFKEALDDGWGYIWGTSGKMWTAADQKKLEETTDSDRANSRKYGSKWIGRRVADCSGLFSWAFKMLGGSIYHGSNTIWDRYCSAKGELVDGKRDDGKELLPGTAVFTYNKTKKKRGHIGLYIGGGWVIEARGAKYGVVKTKLKDRPWVEWGELKGVDYAGAPADPVQPEPVKPESAEEEYPTIRKGSKGKWVTLAQVKLIAAGYSCGPQGADGDFGSNTEKAVKLFQKEHTGPDGKQLTVDGVIGRNTWWALEASPQRVTYTVTIRNLTADQKNKLMNEYPGAETKMEN